MFTIDIRPQEMEKLERNVQQQAEEILNRAASDLAAQTYAKVVELAQDGLHSTREKYLEALDLKQQSESTWVVSLGAEAMWIEDGMDRHEMIDQLLMGKNGKQPLIAKDGSMYKIIPFSLNKAPSRSTTAAKELQQILKKEFKARGIPYGKKELGPDGQPLTGKLHKMDIMDKPIKTHEGVGQGHGPIGSVKQGMGGTPFLKAVNVFQRQLTGPGGQLRVTKDVMTFRIVSSKQKGSGRWVHPGLEAKKFMDKAYEWANNEWQREIKPQVMEEINALHQG